MIKLISFDWNGTFLDDSKLGLNAYNLIRAEYKLLSLTIERMRELYTVPIKDFWVSSGLEPKIWDRDFHELKDHFHDVYGMGASRCQAREGAQEITHWLHMQNIESMILSNHLEEDIKNQLQRLGVEPIPDTILANADRLQTGISRSKGAKLEAYLKFKNISPASAIIVGDTNEEVEIAKRLGMVSVVITGGWESKARLEAAQPDYLVEDLLGLKPIITELNGITSK